MNNLSHHAGRSRLAAVLVVGLALSSACKKDESAPASGSAAAARPPAARITDPHFVLEIKPAADCKVGAECKASIELDALGGYHVNKEYPFRFTAGASTTLEYLGKDPAGPAIFAKGAGDYAAPSEGHSTMTVRFRPKAAGPAEILGAYKFSVCSEQNCQIETADLLAKVDVK